MKIDRIINCIKRYSVNYETSVELKKSYAVARRRFLNKHPMPPLTETEKREIDDYWRQYGVKWPDYTWFQMYYGVTGCHTPRFLPSSIVLPVIYKYYNFQDDISGWDDKNIYEMMNPLLNLPKSLAHKMLGRFYDSGYHYRANTNESLDALAANVFELLEGDTDIILKVSKKSFSGKGVKKFTGIESAKDVKKILTEQEAPNYILQKCVRQHPFFRQFCSTSVNIIRIVSWRHDETISLFPASIRYGTEGNFTDVAYVDGKEIVYVVGVDANGRINDRFVTFDGNMMTHPDIADKQIPNWQELTDTIVKAHERMFFFDLIGWDFTIDEKGKPICIEYNILKPGTILYQFCNGPFAGEYTEQLLEFLKSHNNLIPKFLRYNP